MPSPPPFFPWLPPATWHHLFEALGFLVAGRLAWRFGARDVPSLSDRRRLVIVLGGAVLGALVGAKLLHALEFAPALAAARAPLALWLGGKSIVGGLLGAIAGVELAKRQVGIRAATGDAFVLPLTAGIAIGRLGCFAAGLADGTYGVPTHLPWGVDFGDGVARHPTQLYEALFVLAVGLALARWRTPTLRTGERFRFFVLAYMLFRFAVEFLKPPFGAASAGAPALVPALYGGVLTAIQLAALLGSALYARSVFRFWAAARRPDATTA